MLRRKLILSLGSLILLIMTAGVMAIMIFSTMLNDLSKMGETVLVRFDAVTSIDNSLDEFESALQGIQTEPEAGASGLLAQGIALGDLIRAVDFGGGQMHETNALLDLHTSIMSRVNAIVAEANPKVVSTLAADALRSSRTLHDALWTANQKAEATYTREHARLVGDMRFWAIALGVIFLVVINACILVLIRAAGMILKPIDQLMEANRHLAREEFDYRVDIEQKDEFAELALATNTMAEQLQSNERRRLEVLQQLSRTLNHELNNAIASIDMQLTLLARRSGVEKDSENERRLRDIHETLRKISGTVSCLPQIRRIVLTDYIGDVKMVDLKRSLESEQEAPEVEIRPREAQRA